MRKQNGSVLLAVLVLILLCSLIVLRGVESLRLRLTLMTASVHMEQDATEVFGKVVEFLKHLPVVSGLHCPVFRANSNSNLSRRICAYQPSSGDDLLVNYNAIFKEKLPCEEEVELTGATPSSFISSYACYLEGVYDGGASYAGNVLSLSAIKFSPADKEPVLLAATGLINLQGALEVSSDFLMVAGGDIHLKELRALFDSRITLVSASGKVMVGAISGPAFLKVIAPGDIILPPHAAQFGDILFPPLLESYIIGVSR